MREIIFGYNMELVGTELREPLNLDIVIGILQEEYGLHSANVRVIELLIMRDTRLELR